MSETIRAGNIGPFVEGPRLQGTPKDEQGEPEDDRVQCGLCEELFAPDELTEYRGELYCEPCEEAARDEHARIEILLEGDRS